MNLSCAIVDDEPLALDLLETYVNKTPFLQLQGKYSSAVVAMKGLQENPVDLLFLDIQMPELNGLEFSQMVVPETRIIFTTAFSQYALDSYRVNALDYLLKPISYKEFLEASNKALAWFEMKEASQNAANGHGEGTDNGDVFIYVKSDYKLIQIRLDDILYIEGLKDYVKIYLEHEPRPILSLMSLKSVEEHLPSSRFLRVHRSYIVQKSKIRLIDRGRIVFGKEYIPIPDSYKQELQSYLNNKTIQ